ncbi:GILT family protein [Aspergillus thermomutatus]|uniref:Gamma interferon inducible lysosomal thiol reductase n=1 Tax=Aspergillus thermomutatus TaxID=41047 RepID=A0A397G9C4_ASPTH|nr:uncharacterized protein CDV56_101951 [Aspergillus thermomutatus]RHZ47167.1 hypothetical protein CDV56_101951 [Aspergillus thermomutatus]
MEKLQYQNQSEGLHDLDAIESAEAGSRHSRRDRPASQVLRRTLMVISLGFVLFSVLTWFPVSISKFLLHSCHRSSKWLDDGFSASPFTRADVMSLMEHNPEASAVDNKVPLEVHIMSKCPDARDCLQKLVVPAMEQTSDKVDFGLSFIASVSNKSTDVVCKHGPAECIGDMLILCAANLPFPPKGQSMRRTPTIRSLGFANCLISSYEKIPERSFVEQCALEHGIDFDALNECASQQDDDPGHDGGDKDPLSGIALLRKSALHSEALGVSTSCTVRLDEHVWCVRDGDVWRDCAKGGRGSQVPVFVEEIKKLWKERN